MRACSLRDEFIEEVEFLKLRDRVLSLWPTGREVIIEEAIEYQKQLPEDRNFCLVTERLREKGRTVVFPRGGYPLLEDQIRLCKKLVSLGIPLIPINTDSYTRQGRFDKAEEGIKETIRSGRNMLNGYPLINYGVKNNRRLVEEVEGAFNPRCGRLGNALGAEISFASGITGFAATAFIHFGAYEKDSTLGDCIEACRYSWRLMGYYAEKGIMLTAEMHGWIPAGVFPLSVNIATMIAESLMAARQGVKRIIPLIHFMGNIAQDLAWVKVGPRLLREYLDRFGYTDVIIPGVFGAQIPLYPMPHGLGEAFAFICYSAIVATIAGVQSVFLRTVDEGFGIPSEEAHEITYRSANWIFEVVGKQRHLLEHLMDSEEVVQEEKIAEAEIRALLDKLLEMGDGDVVAGSIKAVEQGVLDSPFSPNRHVKGLVLGVKDSKGAVRYLEFGNLPFPKHVKEFHKERLADRERGSKSKLNYMTSIKDFWAFSKGKLIGE